MKLNWIAALVATFAISSALSYETPYKGYLIKLKSTPSSRALSKLSNLGVQVVNTIPELNLVVAQIPPQLQQKIRSQSMIEYIEPNYYRKTTAISGDIFDKEGKSLWGLRDINSAPAWRITTGNPKVIVAISDTGIYLDHGDLKKNIWYNAGEIGKDANGKDKSKNKIDDDGNGFIDDHAGWSFETNSNHSRDDHYHGTHVAGTVGAKGNDKFGVAGVSWNSKLMSVKFIGKSGWGTDEGAVGSIIYAANNGAKVINCSWGGEEYSQSIYDAIEYAGKKGVMVVAAAGNDGRNNDKVPFYPASYTNENLITVAATYGGNERLASFSNWSPKTVLLAAPGEDIYSTFNFMYTTLHCESKLFCTLSGTSMAAPHVSGAVALLYSVNPNLTFKEIKEILMTTVNKTSDLKGKTISGGALNLGAAVKLAKSL